MNTSKPGFTVIETMLFLSVTGLMLAGMMVAIGSTIGTQRYKDSVETFKSTLQQEYSRVSSVENSKVGQRACYVASGSLQVSDPTPGPNPVSSRGQSSCDIIGRYLFIDRGNINYYTIFGKETGAVSGSNDIAKLTSSGYTLGVSDYISQSSKKLEWGVSIAWPVRGTVDVEPAVGANVRTMAILIIKSPHSGNIYTFTSTGVGTTSAGLKSLISSPAARGQRLICLNPDGLVSSPRRSIFIDANASSSSAVRINTATENPC